MYLKHIINLLLVITLIILIVNIISEFNNKKNLKNDSIVYKYILTVNVRFLFKFIVGLIFKYIK